MADGLNRVTLLGNLGQDPELRQAGDGWVLSIRMATSESYLDRNRVRQERTEWHTVSVWGKRGEALAKILTKGSRVCIEGALRTRSYDDRDGNKRYATDVVARNVILCGGSTRRSSSSEPPDTAGSYGPGYDDGYGSDDDIPF